MKKAETKDRIKEALEKRGMKQSELVEKTGIDKGQLSSYLAGRYRPKQNNLHLIAEALKVDEAWLMGYDVPMEQNFHSTFSMCYDMSNFAKHTENEDKILNYFSKLNFKGEIEAIKRVKELTYVPDYTKNKENLFEEIPGTFEITETPDLPNDTDDFAVHTENSDNSFTIPLHDLLDCVELNAAHARTDIPESEKTATRKQQEEDIMDDPNF